MYLYLDYEPSAIQCDQFRKPATYRQIRAWIQQEYGLTVIARYVAQVKRDHEIITGNRFGPAPENVKVPPEKEAAIEAALRHFGMID